MREEVRTIWVRRQRKRARALAENALINPIFQKIQAARHFSRRGGSKITSSGLGVDDGNGQPVSPPTVKSLSVCVSLSDFLLRYGQK